VDDEDVNHDHHITRQRTPNAGDDARRARDDDDDDDDDADDDDAVVVERATGGEVRTVARAGDDARAYPGLGDLFARAGREGARARGREVCEAWTRTREVVVIASDWCGRGGWWRCVRG